MNLIMLVVVLLYGLSKEDFVLVYRKFYITSRGFYFFQLLIGAVYNLGRLLIKGGFYFKFTIFYHAIQILALLFESTPALLVAVFTEKTSLARHRQT